MAHFRIKCFFGVRVDEKVLVHDLRSDIRSVGRELAAPPSSNPPFSRHYQPSHEIMALFVLRNLILQTRMLSHPVVYMIDFRILRLLPYFMCANSEGSGGTARMCRLA